MALENQTRAISGFILLGFSDLSLQIQRFLFVLLLLIYILAVMGNLLVFTILTVDPVLHTPMYFFLRNFSFLEICFTTVTAPRTLVVLLAEDRSISFFGCSLQMYFFYFFGSAECVLLGIMAYDRYIAICNPLRYSVIMSNKNCFQMAVGSWIICVLLEFGQVSYIISLPFCRSKLIHHFFCDGLPVLRLSCADIYINDIIRLAGSVLFLLIPFLVILSSYIYIISTVLRMHSTDGRSKAFSTCGSHLTVVTLFFGTTMLAYFQQNTGSANERIVAFIYCFVNPMLNPMIYSLRSKEVKGALRRKLREKMSLFRL
ncbi:olfactory receptor 10A7-like [Rhinatrema bivittatum]|uniref:olfactory receptor 10A7-like n=1 Tax=Rhinatrema bivittatum TaxID=194408 RepID=UPI00112B0FF3|nr:olfactory receptor 10A7-like [Rhinatrema bivittatum]